MCEIFSAVYTRAGDLIFRPDVTNSHEDLIERKSLRDDGHDEFARLEFYPRKNGAWDNPDSYALHIDEEVRPHWFTGDMEISVTQRLRERVSRMIVRNDRRILLGGSWILSGSPVVDRCVNACIIHAGSATITRAGSTTIIYAGSARIIHAGSATIENAGSATIENAGSATIGHAGSAMIIRAGSATIGHAGSAMIEHAGSAIIRDAGSARIIHAGSAMIKYANSAIIRDAGSVMIGYAGSATIENVNSAMFVRALHDER